MEKRVLIIDDDPFIRELYEEVLVDAGFAVTTAENGEIGLEQLRKGGFAVILLDVMMPKLDGLGVLSKLQETVPENPNGPIILLTNLDHDPILDTALKMGATAHILKADILPPALVELVNKTIANGTPQPVR